MARIFFEIADLVDLKGELVFKGVAYRRAADAIAHSPEPVAEAFRAGQPPTLPGVGKAIRDKLAELAETGHLRFHDRLRTEVPPELLALVQIPGLGPRSVRELHERLGILTIEDLERAARAGRVRELKGMGPGTEQRILEGIEALGRRSGRLRLGQAAEHLGQVVEALRDAPGLQSLVPAGSFRRRRETIGDLDLLAETDRPKEVIARLVGLPGVARVIGQGAHKASVELRDGPQLDLMIMPPGKAGSYLVHFTGSAEHNVHLRGLARDRGWSLSEHGFVRLGDDGRPLAASDAAADLRTFETEAEVYRFLDLDLMPPELREDQGEIEAAAEGRLPQLVELADLRGDSHCHSDWSDGRYPPERMAEEARRRGLSWLVLTDHSQSLAIARGLTPDRVELQHRLIGQLNERFARETAAGQLHQGAAADGFRLLHGCEMEIRADARLDYPDELLARFDVVVASLHVGRRQPRAQLMARYRAAMESPHVDVIAHPSGRKLGERDELDLDWDAFYALAAETGTLLEINGSDERLDLEPRRARRAKEAGCRFTIDSDAHFVGEFDNLVWGTAMARRAWLEASDVMNTRDCDGFLGALKGGLGGLGGRAGRGGRVGRGAGR
ncbi:MAG TPA: DNA polymerase/3'-5' exonuclease PolX [Candidatus Limnocylindrales bacterium]|nr:DNA polymerase/3'-5' exonuclease PolX [Candidatus Limnocylindrales bacterium]